MNPTMPLIDIPIPQRLRNQMAAAAHQDVREYMSHYMAKMPASLPVARYAPSRPWASGYRQPALEGYATRFLKPHKDKEGLIVIERGAFARSLASGRPVRFLLNHDEIDVVASTSDPALQLLADGDGLSFHLTLPDTALARDVEAKVHRGDMNEMSVGFRPISIETKRIEGQDVRIVLDADLLEISVVAKGAVPGTHVVVTDGAIGTDLRTSARTGGLRTQSAHAAAQRSLQKLLASVNKLR